jgi:hypothetical protein
MRKHKSKTRRKQKGGKAGKMSRVLNFSTSQLVGAGGYGIVLKTHKKVFKLLKDVQACEALKKETAIQQKAYTLLSQHLPEVKVPQIFYSTTQPIRWQDSLYLCGIEMEYLTPPEGFQEQVHMLLGYKEDDIDSEWGMRMSEPVSPTNPTRGFFASPETLELIWKEETSQMTLERLAYLMGRALRILLEGGILPIDLEWVWSDGNPYIIDFGLCQTGFVDPYTFLQKADSEGLASDFYIPHKGDRGYDEFIKGFSINTL